MCVYSTYLVSLHLHTLSTLHLRNKRITFIDSDIVMLLPSKCIHLSLLIHYNFSFSITAKASKNFLISPKNAGRLSNSFIISIAIDNKPYIS